MFEVAASCESGSAVEEYLGIHVFKVVYPEKSGGVVVEDWSKSVGCWMSPVNLRECRVLLILLLLETVSRGLSMYSYSFSGCSTVDSPAST